MRFVVMIFVGDPIQFARLVAQWFTHYATAACKLGIVIGKINLYFTYSFLVFQSGKWNTKRNMREKE